MQRKFLTLLVCVLTLGLLLNPEVSPAAKNSTGRLTNTLNPHNLSSNATHGGRQATDPASGGTTQICIFCHTPHSAEPQTTLWHRPDPDASSFQLYAQDLAIAGTLAGSNADAPDRTGYTLSSNYPNGSSRLCMSCHDGITAIGSFSDGTTIAMLGGLNTVTSVVDLSTSHPISFIYTQTIITNDINPFRSNTYQFPSLVDAIDTPLDGLSRMQCTTCHDPHYNAQLDDVTLPPFWRQQRVTGGGDPYDEVCNACHIGGDSYIATPPVHTLP